MAPEEFRSIVREELRGIVREEVRTVVREEVSAIMRDEFLPLVREEFTAAIAAAETRITANFRAAIAEAEARSQEFARDIETKLLIAFHGHAKAQTTRWHTADITRPRHPHCRAGRPH